MSVTSQKGIFAAFLFVTFVFGLIAPVSADIVRFGEYLQGASDISLDSGGITIFVTPAITDTRILPNSERYSNLISNQITMEGCRGESRPATFTVYTPTNVSGMTISTSNLTGSGGTIPSSAIDIRVVKCWLQDSGSMTSPTGQKVLLPELLLKDDKLLKVENNENYLKMTDGTYRWISDPTKHIGFTTPTPAEFPVQDSATLLPVDLTGGENKQFWIVVKIPDTAQSGTYSGSISLRNSIGELAQISLQLRVLPITLLSPILEYDLYYFGESSTAYPNGSISHQYKSDQQMQAEFRNMADHGIYNVSLGAYGHNIRDWYNLGKLLTAKNAVGMSNRPLYYNFLSDDNKVGGLDWRTTDPVQREAIRQATRDVISFTRQYSVTDVYAYGLDEIYDPTVISLLKPNLQAVQEAGGKVYIAGTQSKGNYFNLLGNAVNLIVNGGTDPDPQAVSNWHSIGSRIFRYAIPDMGGIETPGTDRMDYGLQLWQTGYDGTMNFTYQGGVADIWNDFDGKERDHVFAYPTVNGVIDTLQWEGWREARTDVRYLSTLLDAIQKVKAKGGNTASAEAWVANLKATNLYYADLDVIRAEMISQILSLSSINSPPVLNAIGNKSVTAGQLLQFTVSATDPNGDALTYSATNLPTGASFNAQTKTFAWTPTTGQVATYPGVHFQVSDGTNTVYEDITITVTAINSPPVLLVLIASGTVLLILSICTFVMITLKRCKKGRS